MTIVLQHGTYTKLPNPQVLSSLCSLCAFQSHQSICPFSKFLVGPSLWVGSYALSMVSLALCI